MGWVLYYKDIQNPPTSKLNTRLHNENMQPHVVT